nr:MAG TPA: hypothetical protein [Caudoviricetes sp.]
MKNEIITDEEKDVALGAFYGGNATSVKENMVSILKADGYLETLTSPNGIVTRLTHMGVAFYVSGGYTEQTRKKREESRREFKRNICAAVIGAFSGAVFGFLAGIFANWLNIGGG